MKMNSGFFGSLHYFYSDKIALNDAKSAYVDAFHLLALQVGYERSIRKKFKSVFKTGVETADTNR